jgi:hypothetical protein
MEDKKRRMGRPPKADKDKRIGRPVHVDKEVSGFFKYLKPNGGYSPKINDIIRQSKQFKDFQKLEKETKND